MKFYDSTNVKYCRKISEGTIYNQVQKCYEVLEPIEALYQGKNSEIRDIAVFS